MSGGLVSAAASAGGATAQRFYGVAVATVLDNLDLTGAARVQLRLPWLPGFEPWARVAVATAGASRGTFAIPQSGDEVLVAFNHGDVREPYVVGSLWSANDRPPATGPTDPANKLMVRTRAGHEIVVDDLQQSITVTTSTGQSVTLDQQKVELSAGGGAAKLTLETTGAIKLQAAASIEIKAPQVKIEGADVTVTGTGSATVGGGATCSVQAGLVRIN